jgi:hypothetical protein
MTTIGSSTRTVTLSPSQPDVTLTGTIDAYGAVGIYGQRYAPYAAALLGPAGQNFTFTNAGTIISTATRSAAISEAIVFGSPGTILNTGLITATNAIAIFGSGHSFIDNAGTIIGAAGTGIYLQGAATVTNTGLIAGTAAYAGVNLQGGGLISNAGTIENGILAAGGPVDVVNQAGALIAGTFFVAADLYAPGLAATFSNAGQIDVLAYGVDFTGIGTAANTGTIQAGLGGLFVFGSQAAGFNRGLIAVSDSLLMNHYLIEIGAAGALANDGAAFTNTGAISARNAIGIVAEDGSAVFNAGSIQAGQDGITDTVYTYGHGVPRPPGAAVTIVNAGAILVNNASFTGPHGDIAIPTHGILLTGAGSVTNTATGTIASGGFGIVSQNTQSGAYILNQGHVTAGTGAGLYLLSYGRAQNAQTGTISAGAAGISLSGGGYGYNFGTILAGAGIVLKAGGVAYNFNRVTATNTGLYAAGGQAELYNYNGAVISAYRDAVAAEAGAALYNAGLLDATGATFLSNGTLAFSHGVRLAAGGTVTNAPTGTIIGQGGIFIQGPQAGASILNEGRVTATGQAGIYLQSYGQVTNASTGRVKSARDGIALYGGGYVINDGAITARAAALYLRGGGYIENSGTAAGVIGLAATLGHAGVYNYAGAVLAGTIGAQFSSSAYLYNAGAILGTAFGVILNAGGTVYDTGTISAATAISFAGGPGNLLILSPTARITGIVNGGGGALELLADGKTEGTAALAQVTGFGSVTIAPQAIWDLAGAGLTSPALTFVNDGTIQEAAADLITIASALKGTGLVDLSTQKLTLDGPVAKGETIATAETLALGDAHGFAGKIKAFAPGDTIDLTAFAGASITTHFAAGILTLDNGATAITLAFTSPKNLGQDIFLLTSGSAGTAITLAKPQFARPAPAAGTTLPAPGAYIPLATATRPVIAAQATFTAGWTNPFPRPADIPIITLQG